MHRFVRAVILHSVPGTVLALSTPALAARPADGDEVFRQLAAARDERAITEEEYLLETFRYVFAPERLRAENAPAERTLIKCFTDQVTRFERNRAALSAEAVAELDGYIRREGPGLRATYISPSGLFSITYVTTGVDAVPTTDTTPANGIPDFVERCGEYLDTSWATEITTLGFTAPALPVDGTYDVDFANMGAYGFTTISGFTTAITIENNFVGFPANSDPDGSQLGALKVTCAHEFKHASQFTNNGWSEGGWVELDATWVEDIVFDQTNDYYNYINFNSSNSQFSDPWLALDNGGTGSYEDCMWQHYLSEKHGNQIIVDLWARRAAFPSENMKQSYQSTQQLYGTDWDQSWPDMYEWAWFTGSRAEPGLGFGEAGSYLRMNLRPGTNIAAYPYAAADSVDQLAAHPYRFNPGTLGMQPVIAFNGLDTHTNFTLSVIVKDTSSNITITRPALDAFNDVTYSVPLAWDTITYVGVIVTNSKRTGGVVDYTLNVSQVPAATDAQVTTGPLPTRLELRPAVPNPFRSATNIAYSLPREEQVRVRILDVAGRTVRVLGDGRAPAGENRVVWDGRNASGQEVPAGVYWARVETSGGSVARRIVALR
jgi:hypothetical protein